MPLLIQPSFIFETGSLIAGSRRTQLSHLPNRSTVSEGMTI